MIQFELGAQVVFRIGLSKKGHPQVIQVKHIVPASGAMVSVLGTNHKKHFELEMRAWFKIRSPPDSMLLSLGQHLL